jgi:HAMP domain-containing protein
MDLKKKLFIQYFVISSLIIFIGSISIYQFNSLVVLSELKDSIIEVKSEVDSLRFLNTYKLSAHHIQQEDFLHQELELHRSKLNRFKDKFKFDENPFGIKLSELIQDIDNYIKISDQHLSSDYDFENAVNVLSTLENSENSILGDEELIKNYQEINSDNFNNLERIYNSIVGILGDSINILNSETDKIRDKNMKYLVFIIAASFIIAVLFAFLNSSNISKPIINLSKAVEEIAKGNFNAEIKGDYIRRDDEIGRLSLSLQRVVASMKLAILRIGMSKEELGFGFKGPIKSKKIILKGINDLSNKSQIKPMSDKEFSKALKGIFTDNLGPLGIKFFNRLENIRDKKGVIDTIDNLRKRGILEQDDFQKFKQEVLDLPTVEEKKIKKINSPEKS